MKVFNIYFKIIKKNLSSMLIYLFVFVALTILFTFNSPGVQLSTFDPQRSDIAVVNNDTDSALVAGLLGYLGKTAHIVDIGHNQQSMQDALFFRKVVYIVEIPSGFTQSFLNNGDLRIKKTSIPGSTSAFYMDFLIDSYLNTAAAYEKSLSSLSDEQIAEKVEADLAIHADVSLQDAEKEAANANLPEYFRFLCYALMAIMVLGVTSIMLVFNEGDLRRRNLCAPLSDTSINLQIWLGNLVFALFVWLVMIALSCIARDTWTIDASFLLMCLNTLTMTFASLSIAFLVGTLIRSRGAQQAIANVLSLGLCFISGVFVPQYLLGGTVKAIASFTPTYWYVRALDDIAAATQFNAQTLGPIALSMLIQLGFAAAVLTVALVIGKQKRTSVA